MSSLNEHIVWAVTAFLISLLIFIGAMVQIASTNSIAHDCIDHGGRWISGANYCSR